MPRPKTLRTALRGEPHRRSPSTVSPPRRALAGTRPRQSAGDAPTGCPAGTTPEIRLGEYAHRDLAREKRAARNNATSLRAPP